MDVKKVKKMVYGTGMAAAVVSAFLAGRVLLHPAWAQTASGQVLASAADQDDVNEGPETDDD